MRSCVNAIISGLLAVSNRHGEAIARVVQKMLDFTTKNPHADLQQVREIAETEGTRVAASLNNRVIYLADIGMIAPLLGLLGYGFWNHSFLRCARC
jgi:Biopolymer transport proteins